MRIKLDYGGNTYDVGDTAENREALAGVGEYVSEDRSETLGLELADGGSVILVIGPGVPLAITYLDI